MTCPSCSAENRDGAKFCSDCGARLNAPRTCPQCATENRPGAKFCDECGTQLRQTEEQRTAEIPEHLAQQLRSAVEGERKQATVLFADVSGSMDLAESTDPELWREIMDRFFAHLCDGVHRFEGTVVQFTGDGIMALFGAPIAHEDHAARAGYAALHLRRDLSGYAAELRRDQGLNFSVRMGINSGELVVGAIGEDLRVEYTAIGHTVGLAQRMESLAEPGAIYVTEHSAALMEGIFDLEDLGRFSVKGVKHPVGVCELKGAGSARSRLDVSRARGLSRFVGRSEELAALENALERAKEGRGLVIGVVGEPGVGKSRLCHEFVEKVRAQGIEVFAAGGQAHTRNVPFHAAFDFMRRYFGISEEDPPKVARERVAGRMLLLDSAFADDLPLIFDFLGVADPDNPPQRMDPEARQRRLLDLVGRLVRSHAERELAVNLFEDLHWIDPASAVFLHAMVEAASSSRALIVLNFRPEYRADWMAGSSYEQLPVVPLGSAAVGEMLEHLLGGHESLDGLPEEIRRRTGGNPFFTEEIVRALVEDGTLAGSPGARELARPLHEVAVPPTVHAVLAARIDRLGEREKSLLQAAAVLGKEFGEPVLERVAGLSEPDLAAALRGLVAGEFLYEQALYPEPVYAFRHPLTQEVAYGSQLVERRRRIHSAVATAMLDLYSERLDERAALIAHHFEGAGDELEAARWHARAAVWAGVSQPGSAVMHWRRVRELAAELEETAETGALQTAAAIAILQLGWRLGESREETDRVYRHARAVAERNGDDFSLAGLMAAYGGVVGIQESLKTALPLAEQAAEIARRTGSEALEQVVAPFTSYTYMQMGRTEEALEVTRRMIEVGDKDPAAGAGMGIGSPLAWGLMLHGFLLIVAGDIADGLAELERGEVVARESGDVESLGWLHMSHVAAAHVSGNLEGAQAHVSRSMEIAESIGSRFSQAWAYYNVAWLDLLEGRPDEGLEMATTCLEHIASHRTAAELKPWGMMLMAWANHELGHDGEAETLALRGLEDARERGARAVETFLLHRLAVGRAVLGDPLPEDLLGRALAVAREVRYRPQEAAIHAEWARLARAAANPAADQHLAEALRIYEEVGATGHLARLRDEFAQAPQPS